ncbi:MAG: hypothetical protein ACRDHZ_00130, partial [Ktedonobacteraceae bacterium]
CGRGVRKDAGFLSQQSGNEAVLNNRCFCACQRCIEADEKELGTLLFIVLAFAFSLFLMW